MDFSTLSFREQYRLAASASVFVGMHGAQLMHIFHASIGHPNCCSLVEIFPYDDKDKRTSFHLVKAYGNMARLLGFSYFGYEMNNENDVLTESGSRVDVSQVSKVVGTAVDVVRVKTSCIMDNV